MRRSMRTRPARTAMHLIEQLDAARVNAILLADVEHIVLASHSGGYTALARGLDRGGIDVDGVELFDSLYGEIPSRALRAGPCGLR